MNTKIIAQVEESIIKTDLPNYRVGDTVRLGIRVPDSKEGLRTQYFEGILIRKSNSGTRRTLTVRKIGANGVGVERIVPLHSPMLESLSIVKEGSTRRAKLYYLRNRIGKAALAVKSR